KIKVPWRLRELTNQISRRLSALSCTLVHTYREGNMVAAIWLGKGWWIKQSFELLHPFHPSPSKNSDFTGSDTA
ncbi:unnamed protein product, partial [Ilex paraguariensis]